jgi:hypothetical protein
MFADSLTHPSTPIFQDRPTLAANDALQDELPTLLRQSLVMWERIFAEQDKAQERYSQVEPADIVVTTPNRT